MQQTISVIEKKWLDALFEFNKKEFSKVHLPSHNELHHLRVWQNAKEILDAYTQIDENFDEVFIEQLIIAVFFHDLGMVVSTQSDHGLLGRKMAENFLSLRGPNTQNYHPALNAIELHDDKEYQSINASLKPDVYTILTMSDDLDAFGAIGVFRYLEIYYMRNIPLNEIRESILKNVETRFQHLVAKTNTFKAFTEKHKKRKEISEQIINEFNNKDLEIIFDLFEQKLSLKEFTLQLLRSERVSLVDWGSKILTEL